MKEPKWYRYVLYGLFVIARSCLPLLPFGVVQTIGKGLGTVAYGMLHHQRRVALEHLTLALGNRYAPAERRRIIRRMFQHLGMTGMEWLALPRLTAADVQRLVRVEGSEHVQQALQRGKGLIVLSAHVGNWEMLMAYFGLFGGFRGAAIARRLRYPEYEVWLRRMRESKHVETLDRDVGPKEMIRRLRANEGLGILADQDVDSIEGIFVDFFGRPAYTPTGPAALALTTGAAMLPAYIWREGRQFHLRVEEPIAIRDTGNRARDLREITEAWSRVTERMITAHPEQWVWMHRRWKTQPETVTR